MWDNTSTSRERGATLGQETIILPTFVFISLCCWVVQTWWCRHAARAHVCTVCTLLILSGLRNANRTLIKLWNRDLGECFMREYETKSQKCGLLITELSLLWCLHWGARDQGDVGWWPHDQWPASDWQWPWWHDISPPFSWCGVMTNCADPSFYCPEYFITLTDF